MQHPSHEFKGNNQGALIIDQTTSGKAIAPLPQKYTSVLLAIFSNSKAKKSRNGLKSCLKKTALRENRLDILVCIYHSSMQEAMLPPSAINALLLFFLDSAHLVAFNGNC